MEINGLSNYEQLEKLERMVYHMSIVSTNSWAALRLQTRILKEHTPPGTLRLSKDQVAIKEAIMHQLSMNQISLDTLKRKLKELG